MRWPCAALRCRWIARRWPSLVVAAAVVAVVVAGIAAAEAAAGWRIDSAAAAIDSPAVALLCMEGVLEEDGLRVMPLELRVLALLQVEVHWCPPASIRLGRRPVFVQARGLRGIGAARRCDGERLGE